MMGRAFVRPGWEYENKIAEIRVEEDITLKELGEIAGIGPGSIQGLQQGYLAPFYESGQLKPWVEKICRFFKATPAHIFPREICEIAKNEFSDEQLTHFLVGKHSRNGYDPDVWQLRERLFQVISSLPTGRYRLVILLRYFKEMTLSEIAEILMVSRTRVQQLEAKALRMLRHPNRSRIIKDFIET